MCLHILGLFLSLQSKQLQLCVSPLLKYERVVVSVLQQLMVVIIVM